MSRFQELAAEAVRVEHAFLATTEYGPEQQLANDRAQALKAQLAELPAESLSDIRTRAEVVALDLDMLDDGGDCGRLLTALLADILRVIPA